MALSGTVAFRPDVEEVVTEAYERCGIDPQTRTGDQAVSARRSLNLLFSEFANRGINYCELIEFHQQKILHNLCRLWGHVDD